MKRSAPAVCKVRLDALQEPAMNASNALAAQSPEYELRFSSFSDAGRGFAFPCDAQGRVDLDDLSDYARSNYFYARTLIGREFGAPCVLLRSSSPQTRDALEPLAVGLASSQSEFLHRCVGMTYEAHKVSH
jgi:hypothetical protein